MVFRAANTVKSIILPTSILIFIGLGLGTSLTSALSLKIAAFNIRLLSPKILEPENRDRLKGIILTLKKNDIVLVQELIGHGYTAVIERILNELNSDQPFVDEWAEVHSELLPRNNDVRHREAYAYFYRTRKVSVIGDENGYCQWPERATTDETDERDGDCTIRSEIINDETARTFVFKRPPFIVKFATAARNVRNRFRFGFIGFHAIYSNVSACKKEVEQLDLVYKNMKKVWNMEDFIIGGDFNTRPNKGNNNWGPLFNDPYYMSVINYGVWTNVAQTQTYDRLVLAGNQMRNYYVEGSGKPSKFAGENGRPISDHYPVRLKLRINRN